MPFVERKGQPRLHYAVDDFTDPWQNAPVVLLQHGNGRSAKFWYQWVPALARHYRVVRPDMRGLGESGRDFDLATELTEEHCVADLVAIIGALGVDSVHFVGESSGGIIGLGLAATHPELVKTLTLAATPVYISDKMKAGYALQHGSRADAMRGMGIRKWVDTTNRSTRFPPETEEGFFNWYADEFAKGDIEVLLRLVQLVNDANALDWLPKVQCPVLGLYPTGGPITDAEQERLLTTHLKNFKLVHLPTQYHMVHHIVPEACTAELLKFLKQHP